MLAWTCRASDHDGIFDVACALDILFVLENKFGSVRRIEVCLDAIGVPTGSEGERFFAWNPKKSQVTSRLSLFWSSLVPKARFQGLIGSFFCEDSKVLCPNFRELWTLDLISDLDPLEAKKLVALFPG